MIQSPFSRVHTYPVDACNFLWLKIEKIQVSDGNISKFECTIKRG
jgi:hypothetical protein